MSKIGDAMETPPLLRKTTGRTQLSEWRGRGYGLMTIAVSAMLTNKHLNWRWPWSRSFKVEVWELN